MCLCASGLPSTEDVSTALEKARLSHRHHHPRKELVKEGELDKSFCIADTMGRPLLRYCRRSEAAIAIVAPKPSKRR